MRINNFFSFFQGRSPEHIAPPLIWFYEEYFAIPNAFDLWKSGEEWADFECSLNRYSAPADLLLNRYSAPADLLLTVYPAPADCVLTGFRSLARARQVCRAKIKAASVARLYYFRGLLVYPAPAEVEFDVVGRALEPAWLEWDWSHLDCALWVH